MKKFEFKTVLILEVPSIVVAANETEAKERLKSVQEHALKNEVKAIYIEKITDVTFLKNQEEIPVHFSQEHMTLLEMGYPLDRIEKYSQEDAEAEIDAALTLI